jgi:VIT1/CCC1 family predicted Fe2+/Mn2+ transporter
MVRTDSSVIVVSLVVVLATLALGGFVVTRLSGSPARIAGVLTALAVLLGALVPILHVLSGR